MRTGRLLGWLGRGLLIAQASGIIAAGCGPSRAPELPDPDVDWGFGDVVVLTFTTRATDGLLGHVAQMEPAPFVDPHRRAIRGAPRVVDNDQHLRLVMRLSENAEAGAGYGPVGANARTSRATHVAYDVRVTGYLEYAPAELVYDAESGCCLGGALSQSCGNAYVSRLFRGTGRTQLLGEVSTEAGVHAGEILRASGGKSFRKLSESSFVDSYFAYEVSSLTTLCNRLPPDAEFAEMKVEGARNCFLTHFDASGRRARDAWSLPDAGLCREVASRRCAEKPATTLRCEAHYLSPKAGSSEPESIDLRISPEASHAVTAPALTPQPAPVEAGAGPPPAP